MHGQPVCVNQNPAIVIGFRHRLRRSAKAEDISDASGSEGIPLDGDHRFRNDNGLGSSSDEGIHPDFRQSGRQLQDPVEFRNLPASEQRQIPGDGNL